MESATSANSGKDEALFHLLPDSSLYKAIPLPLGVTYVGRNPSTGIRDKSISRRHLAATVTKERGVPVCSVKYGGNQDCPVTVDSIFLLEDTVILKPGSHIQLYFNLEGKYRFGYVLCRAGPGGVMQKADAGGGGVDGRFSRRKKRHLSEVDGESENPDFHARSSPGGMDGTDEEVAACGEDLMRLLSCPICHDCLVDPVCMPCGAHVFCRRCVDDWLKKDPTCPTCRALVPVNYHRAISSPLKQKKGSGSAPSGQKLGTVSPGAAAGNNCWVPVIEDIVRWAIDNRMMDSEDVRSWRKRKGEPEPVPTNLVGKKRRVGQSVRGGISLPAGGGDGASNDGGKGSHLRGRSSGVGEGAGVGLGGGGSAGGEREEDDSDVIVIQDSDEEDGGGGDLEGEVSS